MRPEAEALVKPAGIRSEHADEEVDRAGHPGAGEDHRVVVLVAAHRVADDRPGVLAEARRLEPRPGQFGAGVRVQRQDRLADPVLDERQARPDAV